MKYIDTNILVRVITGDNEELAKQAIARIQSGGQNEFSLLDAILVELCFVLEYHDYKMLRSDIAEALEALTSVPQILVSESTRQALKVYRANPKLDYADCLLFVLGGKEGVFTFDKDLRKALS